MRFLSLFLVRRAPFHLVPAPSVPTSTSFPTTPSLSAEFLFAVEGPRRRFVPTARAFQGDPPLLALLPPPPEVVYLLRDDFAKRLLHEHLEHVVAAHLTKGSRSIVRMRSSSHVIMLF